MENSKAIIIGSVIIAIAVLISGDVIEIKGLTGKPAAGTPVASSAPQEGDQKALSEADIVVNLKAEAKKLNLDQGKFDKCLDGGDKASLVATDASDGSAVGVSGTPAFFINGRLIEGAVPFAQIKQIIDEELNGSAASTVERKTVGVGNLPIQGKESAAVTLVEFSDYECPFCSRHFVQTEPQIKEDYIDKGIVKFYYRDYPLSQIHPGAEKAAEAARCAGDQNKYWEYHDALFQNQANIF